LTVSGGPYFEVTCPTNHVTTEP